MRNSFCFRPTVFRGKSGLKTKVRIAMISVLFWGMEVHAQPALKINYAICSAADQTGSLYIVCNTGSTMEKGNSAIIKVDASGHLLPLAYGKTTYADRDRNLTHANLDKIVDIVLDRRGTIFLSSAGAQSIVRITPGGQVSDFAGGVKRGSIDGQGTAAQFDDISGLFIDKQDILYAVDQKGKSIRKITPDAVVSTIISNSASFIHAIDLVIDKKGNMFIADMGGHSIKKVNLATNSVAVFAGGSARRADGEGKAAGFLTLGLLGIDSDDNMYVMSSNQDLSISIQKIAPSSSVTTIAGRSFTSSEKQDLTEFGKNPPDAAYLDGPAKKILLNAAAGITVDPANNLYFPSNTDNFFRMYSKGSIYTVARKSQAYTARNFKTVQTADEGTSDVVEVKKSLTEKEIERMVDSMYKNYKNPIIVMAPPITQPFPADSIPRLPSKNLNRLAAARRTLATKEELVGFIDLINREMKEAFPGISVLAFEDPQTGSRASYGYYITGRVKESLMEALFAAEQAPDNNLFINNLGATLSLCGIDYLAMPVLNYASAREPGNSTIANNIGQAWLSMGDLAQAEKYFLATIQASPYHPHANSSLALIYKQQGKFSAAIACFENSLRGAYTASAINGLLSLHKDAITELYDLLRHRYKQPEYFNPSIFKTPAQCLNVEDVARAENDYKIYLSELDKAIVRYTLLKKNYQPALKKVEDSLRALAAKGILVISPFMQLGSDMVSSTFARLLDALPHLQKQSLYFMKRRKVLEIQYKQAQEVITEKFKGRVAAVGEGNPDRTLDDEICNAMNEAANTFLVHFAALNVKEFEEGISLKRSMLNDELYWMQMACPTKEQYQDAFFDMVIGELQSMKDLKVTTLAPYCQPYDSTHGTYEVPDIQKPLCPFTHGLEIPFVVGKINADCEGWEIETGEGVIFNLSHKNTGETTIAFGAGDSYNPMHTENNKDWTPEFHTVEQTDFKFGVEGGGKMQFFLTFNGFRPMDAGFLWEAELDLKGAGKGFEAKQTFVWGLNKGFTADGLLTDLGDKWLFGLKPEKQLNPRLPIYKQKDRPKPKPKLRSYH